MGTKRKHQMLDQMEDLEQITEEQFAALKTLSEDRAADIRYRVAERLGIAGACGSQDAVPPLKQCAVSDSCFMVRGYAACSAAEIALRTGAADAELTAFFERTLNKEKDDWVQASLCAVLYLLGRDDYLSRLIGALDNDAYEVRCAAANLLVQMAKEKDASMIQTALKNRREKENSETLSVISTIDRCLKEMDDAQR